MKLFRLTLLTVLFYSANHCYAKTNNPLHAAIYQTATEYIAQNIAIDADYELTFNALDPRLRLDECETSLEAFTINGKPITSGRNSIGIRCNSDHGWTIFTSAKIKTFENILVLAKPIRRGGLFTLEHVVTQKRDTAKLRNGYIKNFASIANKQATRNLAAGAILNLSNATEPLLVKRGDKIMIRAAAKNYDIQMQGLALMSGHKGQSIRVKNESSGRIVAAKVIESGLVTVNF